MFYLRNFFLIAVFALMTGRSKAQLIDTISYSMQQKPRFFLNLVTFNSYISGDFANFTGLRFGASFNKRVRIGMGVFGLAQNTVVSSIQVDDGGNIYNTNANLNFKFLSWSAEYVYYNEYPWQFSVIPFQLGLGSVNYEYIRRSDRQRIRTENEGVMLYHPDLTGQYNIFKWLGLGASLGYRVTLFSSDNVSDNFNSPTFSLNLKLFMDEVYNAFFPHGISGKKSVNVD
ncbi:MAG: hypothetical protein DWQ48_02535 [Bacteroidetes bacterium]|nr:MAG: hypothetical protein DWQ48_02535 [Bacteroidota bacterium]